MEDTERVILYTAVLVQAIIDVIVFLQLIKITESLASAWMDISSLWLAI